MTPTIQQLEREHHELTQKLAEARRSAEPQPVDDYSFSTWDGHDLLTQLFGDGDELIVVHNMGKQCPYCTLWADGLNGVVDHLESRAAFVVCSPDSPHIQNEFAQSRGWRFRMISGRGSPFAKDMGYEPQPGKPWPGVSAFRLRDDGIIVRTGTTNFGPGDQFCAVWHLFDLLGVTENEWQPKYWYETAKA